ncbi:MAG TPA: bifunctional hydroxymethylpyrimidine kinase/phosphomethylpyrimidine kinase [Caulobacteraceae bacterium]
MGEFRGRVLAIGGSDPGGGAGIQADIKTVTALGGYAASVITAVTVQNSRGVSAVQLISAEMIEAQGRAVLGDIGADAIKIGMLGTIAAIEVVARLIDSAPATPVVVDPVMVAKGGRDLLEPSAIDALRALLIPGCALVTPNAPEALALTGIAIVVTDDLRRAGEALLRMGARAVLMKGGHVDGDTVVDLLMTPAGETTFSGPRIASRHTHGTGCTLASACATGLAQGMGLDAAVARAWGYTAQAIRHAPGFGAGHGPLDHGWTFRER